MDQKTEVNLNNRITLSVKEAAQSTGVSDDSIRRAIWSGDLKALRPGRGRQGKVVILRESLMAWLKGLEDTGV